MKQSKTPVIEAEEPEYPRSNGGSLHRRDFIILLGAGAASAVAFAGCWRFMPGSAPRPLPPGDPGEDQPADAGAPYDLDADEDRIPDDEDQCPEEPETYNGVDDEDGCPDRPKGAVVSPSTVKSRALPDQK